MTRRADKDGLTTAPRAGLFSRLPPQNPVLRAAAKRGFRAFTLIEMLVATVLAAVLMSAVLAMLAGVSRDRKKLSNLDAPQSERSMVELVRWDLGNAATIAFDSANHSTILTGSGGIDAASLVGNGRLVQVTYQIQSGNLWRIQEYLDDPAHPGVWAELVASNALDFSLDPNPGPESPLPSRMRIRMAGATANVDQLVWIR